MWVTLEELRPGAIFETQEGVRAVKSEYHYSNDNPQSLCILLASGEFAHFPDKERTLVREIFHASERAGLFVAPLSSGEWCMTAEERARAIYMAYPEMVDMDGSEFVKYAASHIRAAEDAMKERCALACDDISADRWQQYKGHGRHAPNNPGRADPFIEGQSHGADACAAAIRALS